MSKRQPHPFIQAMHQRRKLMNRLLLGLDPAYQMALTNIPNARLAYSVLTTPRLQARMLQRFAHVFELPERPDIPPAMVELLEEPPQLWSEIMKAAGLMLNFKRLPPVFLKDEMEYLAQLFGRRIVGTIFQHRNFAPYAEPHLKIRVEDIDFPEFYESGARALRMWATQRLGDMIGWFTPLLPPALGEDQDDDSIEDDFQDALLNAQDHEEAYNPRQHKKPERSAEEIQKDLATIDLLLPLIRTLVHEMHQNGEFSHNSPVTVQQTAQTQIQNENEVEEYA